MALIFLASFPNSRVKPRGASTQNKTIVVACLPNVNTRVLLADSKRTYACLRNPSNIDLKYGYASTDIKFDVLAGQERDGLDTIQEVWINNPDLAVTVNLEIDYGRG